MAFLWSHQSIFRGTKLIDTAITAINKSAPLTVAAKLQQHKSQVLSAVSPYICLFPLHKQASA